MLYLQEIPYEANCHDPIATTHATQMVALYVSPKLEVVDQHAGKAGCGTEDRAVGHQNVDITGTKPCSRRITAYTVGMPCAWAEKCSGHDAACCLRVFDRISSPA